MMPKGVEHAGRASADNIDAEVPDPLMPKGVEHRSGCRMLLVCRIVPFPLMPKPDATSVVVAVLSTVLFGFPRLAGCCSLLHALAREWCSGIRLWRPRAVALNGDVGKR